MVKDAARETDVERRFVLSQKGDKITKQKTGTIQPKNFFDNKAFQIRSFIRLDSKDRFRAQTLQHVSMTSFKGAELKNSLTFEATQLFRGPGYPSIVKQ